jgi:hypothetical protein
LSAIFRNGTIWVEMAAAAQQQNGVGEHPMTGELVATLRRGEGGFVFTPGDIERFRNNGTRLAPVTLLSWLRDLTVLAITLRDDMGSNIAAQQIERGLIDPLTHVLDDHVANRGAAEVRAQVAKDNAAAERKKLADNRIALPQSKGTGITMLRPKKRSDA